jgi:hypothetical protein
MISGMHEYVMIPGMHGYGIISGMHGYTVKKGSRDSRPPAGTSLPNSPWAGIMTS